jgi:hypothetical protein
MPLDDPALQTAGNAIDGVLTHMRLHSADPGTTETSALGSGRVACAFTSDADGDLTLDATVNFTGLGANATVAFVTLWNASTAGIRQGKFAVTGDTTANAAGEYSITALTLTGTSS